MTATVLVTGASSGIGRAAALALSQRGFSVYAGARGPLDYEGVTRVELDVTDPDHVEALRELPIDALVNNAGIAVIGPLEYLPLDELRRQLEVNTVGQLAVIQACLPALRRTHGRIVNVSSISGRVALPLYGPYAASKFALEALSDSLRRELRGAVGVSLIQPGAVATPIWHRTLDATPTAAGALRRHGRAAAGHGRGSARDRHAGRRCRRRDPPRPHGRQATDPLRPRPRRPHPGAPRPRVARSRHGPTDRTDC